MEEKIQIPETPEPSPPSRPEDQSPPSPLDLTSESPSPTSGSPPGSFFENVSDDDLLSLVKGKTVEEGPYRPPEEEGDGEKMSRREFLSAAESIVHLVEGAAIGGGIAYNFLIVHAPVSSEEIKKIMSLDPRDRTVLKHILADIMQKYGWELGPEARLVLVGIPMFTSRFSQLHMYLMAAKKNAPEEPKKKTTRKKTSTKKKKTKRKKEKSVKDVLEAAA